MTDRELWRFDCEDPLLILSTVQSREFHWNEDKLFLGSSWNWRNIALKELLTHPESRRKFIQNQLPTFSRPLPHIYCTLRNTAKISKQISVFGLSSACAGRSIMH
uniref:Uncharacterized protein n=1 Tax=Physcomitrium patens TaxID=3218 RepID=A0A2K1K6C1_PHYPA|nr:hypothetical protein PHYPA_011217 [Physcomitrium patens]